MRLLKVLALLSEKHRVVGCVSRVLASACVVLLCLLVVRLFMCLFVLHDIRCRHVLLSPRLQRLHSGEMSCLSTCFSSSNFPCFWYFNDWWI